MTSKDVSKAILKYGVADSYSTRGKKRAKTVCQGCGKPIYNDNIENIDAVITKRGDGYFWHHKCIRNITKIKSVERG